MSKFAQILVLAVFLFIPTFVKADPIILINFDDPSPAPLQTYRSLGVEISTILLQPNDSLCPALISHCTFVGTINNIELRSSPSAVSLGFEFSKIGQQREALHLQLVSHRSMERVNLLSGLESIQ